MADQFPGTTKKVLSPAAQSVLDAFRHAPPVVVLGDYHAIRCRQRQIAAALRAAVDQVVPEVDLIDEEEWIGQSAWQQAEQSARFRLLAIATELETH